jgi:hypothetical protein
MNVQKEHSLKKMAQKQNVYECYECYECFSILKHNIQYTFCFVAADI